MANYIITKNQAFFKKVIPAEIALKKSIKFCSLEEMILLDKIAIDTETTGLDPKIDDLFCVQLGTGANNYIIDLYTSENAYTFKEVQLYIENRVLVFHNACFDLGFFYKHGFIPDKNNVRDTMIGNKILFNGTIKRNDFGSVMKDILGIEYDKTDQKNINIVKLSQKSTIEYSFNDVDQLLKLETEIVNRLKENKQLETYELHCQWIRSLAYMERCGLPISSKKWIDKMENDIIKKSQQEMLIKNYIREFIPEYSDEQLDLFQETHNNILINLTSPKQMIPVFNKLGIKTKNKEGKDSIKEDIITKTKHEFVEMWLEFQEANHRITTFGASILDKVIDERIFTKFNPMVDTARLSTRKGEINFLNFPSDSITRNCFQTKKGKKLIVCDFEGQETVVLGDLSKDEAMVKAVLEGADLHSAFARKIFPEIENLNDDEIKTKHKDKRSFAKAPRFALSYGGNAFTIHQNLNIPYSEALKIEEGYKELHAGVYAWGNEIFYKAVKLGYIKSADGWRLYLPFFNEYKKLDSKIKDFSREDWSKYKIGKTEYKKFWEEADKGIKYEIINNREYEFFRANKKSVSDYFKLQSSYKRLCLNFPIQSTAAMQTKRATLEVFEWILSNKYFDKVLICNVVHDEMVLECPEEMSLVVKDMLGNLMRVSADYYLKDLNMGAEANIGNNWYEAK